MMDDKDDDNELGMNLNDFDSGIQLEEPKSNKKIIIITIIIILLLLIIAVIIFIIFLPHGKSKPINELIECKYNIKDNSKSNNILSEEFNLTSDLTIFIDDKKVKNTKTYKFKKAGENTVKYKINSKEINLDYIFKDVKTLNSVEMKSKKKKKITIQQRRKKRLKT